MPKTATDRTQKRTATRTHMSRSLFGGDPITHCHVSVSFPRPTPRQENLYVAFGIAARLVGMAFWHGTVDIPAGFLLQVLVGLQFWRRRLPNAPDGGVSGAMGVPAPERYTVGETWANHYRWLVAADGTPLALERFLVHLHDVVRRQ